MIMGIPVEDQGQPSDGQLKAHVGFLHPQVTGSGNDFRI
jgi:hypothetical protein